MSFWDLFNDRKSGIFAQILNGAMTMPTVSNMPIKFECHHCQKIYMQKYSAEALVNYPHCPDCDTAGMLLGSVETEDILKHPVTFIKSFFNLPLLKQGT